MKPTSDKSRSEERESGADRTSDAEKAGRNTPSTDMQPEDAGTAASGAGRANAVEGAMKQTSKTGNETGSGR